MHLVYEAGQHDVGGDPLARIVDELHIFGFGADHGAEGGVHRRYDAGDALDALLQVHPPRLADRVGVREAFHDDGAHAEAGENTARPQAGNPSAEIHDDGGSRRSFAFYSAFEALHVLFHYAARVDQLSYVRAVGPTVLLAHEGLLDRPHI